MIIVKAVQTCWACPSQWDAWTDTGIYLYLRYRYGYGSVRAYPKGNLGDGITVAAFDHGDALDGSISLAEFAELAGLTLDLR